MSEQEWRRLGVQMSQGWVHFLLHAPGKLNIYHFVLQSDRSGSIWY